MDSVGVAWCDGRRAAAHHGAIEFNACAVAQLGAKSVIRLNQHVCVSSPT